MALHQVHSPSSRLDKKSVTIKAKLVKMSTSEFVLLLNLQHGCRLVVEREKRINTFDYNHSIVSCHLAAHTVVLHGLSCTRVSANFGPGRQVLDLAEGIMKCRTQC
jgi:hypothetical protein